MNLHTIEDLIFDISVGKMVILADNASRENEGDLVFAAKFADREKVNFMTKFGRGLICVPISEERANLLNLKRMTENNSDRFGTAFTVSVDAKNNITTGISAYDRAQTIKLLSNEDCHESDLIKPGHMFPLIAKAGGVLSRPGHTEAAVDIVELAKIKPRVGVICEIMNDDGTMAKIKDLLKFSEQHNIKISTIDKLIKYKLKHYQSIKFISEAVLPIQKLGCWKIYVFYSAADHKEHVALVKGKLAQNDVLTRIHSECFTGDVLGSMRCDCQNQLFSSMRLINSANSGVIIYLRQEGRGIGLGNKIKAYALQEQGFDTVEANEQLGFYSDMREYSTAAKILKFLNITSIQLITNNPAKVSEIEKLGIKVIRTIGLPSDVNEFNKTYLQTKRDKLGHNITI